MSAMPSYHSCIHRHIMCCVGSELELGLHVWGKGLVLAWRRVHPCVQLQTHLDQAAGCDRVGGGRKDVCGGEGGCWRR